MVAAETEQSTAQARVVLVVDCCPETGAPVGPILAEAFGAYAVSVTDAAGATRWLGKVRPSVALVCLCMQDGGLTLIERMRYELPMADVPVVAMGAPEEKEDALAAGCAGFLIRPLVSAEVVRALRPLLEGPEPVGGLPRASAAVWGGEVGEPARVG